MPQDAPLAPPVAQPLQVGSLLIVVRVIVGVILAPFMAVVAVIALSLTGWGFETDPGAQFRRDLPQLVTCAVAGASSGAALGFALAGLRRVPIVLFALAGIAPAVILATAYFTERY